MESAVFRSYLDDIPDRKRELVVVNRTENDPVLGLLDRTFDRVTSAIRESQRVGEAENLLCLVEDGDVVATSPLSEVMDALLLVNSDLYRTSSSGFERQRLPDVIRSLSDSVFSLRGYPMSNKEKLIFVLISRVVEHTAWSNGVGTLRSTFQRLSRIRDELGTWQVYQRLAEADVETHLYGVPDWIPDESAFVVHTGDDVDYRRSWCVVYRHPEDGDDAALVAVETERNVWRGMWTFDDVRVRRADELLTTAF